MKKIINGIEYNTDTAEQLVSWNNYKLFGRMLGMKQTIYLADDGETNFVHIEGGAYSKYGKEESGRLSEGEDIVVLGKLDSDVTKWMDENWDMLKPYETKFGKVEM